MQRWRFLGITDPDVKQAVGTYYKRAWDEVVYPRYSAGDPAPGTSPERSRRMLEAAQYLADQIHEAPVWIVPCLAGAYPFRTAGSSIYPAVQNILLAARALGLGATPATLYLGQRGARPNHVGVIARHKRAGRIEPRDGKLYATQSAMLSGNPQLDGIGPRLMIATETRSITRGSRR